MSFCHIAASCLLTYASVAFHTLHYGSISRGVTRGRNSTGAESLGALKYCGGRRMITGAPNDCGCAEWLFGRLKVPTMSQALSSIQ